MNCARTNCPLERRFPYVQNNLNRSFGRIVEGFRYNICRLWSVDHLDQTKRADRELNVVRRARLNQRIETYKTNEVPEPKFGVKPLTVTELPALPVWERQQENMLLHQQLELNMLEEEVVSFGQRAQQQQDQQQLQLRQHNIPHNPVYPEQVMSPKRPNVETPNQGGPPGPEAPYQQNNLLKHVLHLEWDQGLR